MNKTLKRVLSLFLIITLTAGIAVSSAFSSAALTQSELKAQIEADYKKALSLKGWSSFYGYCNIAAAYQLLAKGVYTGSSPDYQGGGNQWYYDYKDTKKTSGGYNVITIGGSDCIDRLIETYGDNLTNIAVSYGTGGSSGSTHVVVISAIIDGYVYFTDSFRYWNSPEGGCRVWSVSEFKSAYRRMNGNPYGLVYFSKTGASIDIDDEKQPEFEPGEYAIVVDELNVRSAPTTSSSVLGQLNSHENNNSQENTKVTITEVKDNKWGKFDYNGRSAWICLYNNGKPYAAKLETESNDSDSELIIAQISRDTESAKTDRDIVWIASVVGGSGEYEYCFDVFKDGELYEEGSFTQYKEIFFTADEDGDYSVAVTVRDSDGREAQFKTEETVSIKSKTDILMGDVNFDGKITVSDARTTLRGASGLIRLSDEAKLAADINGDGKVTASDARKILRKAAHLE